MKSGLSKIKPDSRDYSLIPTFGALPADIQGLPDAFSVYDGRQIPNQEERDNRFTPPLIALPFGCTGETGTFDAGIQDNDLYNPYDLYANTAPGFMNQGRDMRLVLGTLISRGPRKWTGEFGPKRSVYFNCYGSGKIDDFDAARIALWINQSEKRGVWVGSWWYPEFATPNENGTLITPGDYNTARASLHAHLVTGWVSIDNEPYLEDISWQGEEYGAKGIVYFSRAQYNALMKQPFSGSFTITKLGVNGPVSVGIQAYKDHVVYVLVQFVRSLFGV